MLFEFKLFPRTSSLHDVLWFYPLHTRRVAFFPFTSKINRITQMATDFWLKRTEIGLERSQIWSTAGDLWDFSLLHNLLLCIHFCTTNYNNFYDISLQVVPASVTFMITRKFCNHNIISRLACRFNPRLGKGLKGGAIKTDEKPYQNP